MGSCNLYLRSAFLMDLHSPNAASEILLDDNEDRRFTNLLKAASNAGIDLHITPGVLEEVERHLNLSITCLDTGPSAWKGRIPFLLSAYFASGQPISNFRSWLENFSGKAMPKDDIAEYLREECSETVKSLEEDMNRADLAFRTAVQEIWHAAHERRRKPGAHELDSLTIDRLVRHDVENYVGGRGKEKQRKGVFSSGVTQIRPMRVT